MPTPHADGKREIDRILYLSSRRRCGENSRVGNLPRPPRGSNPNFPRKSDVDYGGGVFVRGSVVYSYRPAVVPRTSSTPEFLNLTPLGVRKSVMVVNLKVKTNRHTMLHFYLISRPNSYLYLIEYRSKQKKHSLISVCPYDSITLLNLIILIR